MILSILTNTKGWCGFLTIISLLLFVFTLLSHIYYKPKPNDDLITRDAILILSYLISLVVLICCIYMYSSLN